MILDYIDFFNLRRNLIFSSTTGIPPIVSYKQYNNGSYNVKMITPEGLEIESDVDQASDITDFESIKKQHCQKMNLPNGLDVKTHNFADNSTWIHGTTNSLYALVPSSGKMLRIKKFGGVLDKNITFGTGQEFKVLLWESYDGSASCPAYVSGTKTSYGTPLYNPPTTQTGWIKVYPDPGDVQEVEVWVYFNSNVPEYKVTVFNYPSLADLKAKSHWAIYGDELFINFEYMKEGINILLRNSLNERIEFYINNDTEYDDSGTNKGAIAHVSFHSYDEW